ncbi:hypothetical protein K1T71_003463 [Dendrolimus kikuchii]|uniref:Uncharacterized protein n=1 Tax=Dendrolimus kikuchii TaxID=765133 RepID=A0ACC1DCN9_9NEOP|nr:hypothetical protein K1T71_003463 [Dendrolimus kikuchii]
MKFGIVLFCVIVVCAYARVTPDYFPSCKRSDPEIEKCALEAIENMRAKLKEGIPEVNIPSVDPFTVPNLKLDRTAQNLRIKATVKNAKAYGGSDFKIEKLKLNLNNKYAGEIKMTFPKLVVNADYDVRGSQILTIDISGKGKLKGNFTSITVVAKGTAKPITKDGVQYLQADKVITKVRIGHGQIAVDDTQRPVAASSAATFFNSNPNVVLDILTPLIEETSAAVVKAFLNKIFNSIPLNELLVDDGAANGVMYIKTYINIYIIHLLLAHSSVCHYTEPDVAQCIQRVAEQARQILALGVPSLNIQPLEPLKIPSIRLRQHNMPKNGFKYDAWLSDVTLKGLTNYTFNKLDVFPEEMKIKSNISLPHLLMAGDYMVIGEFQMLPVESAGTISANFTQCTAALEALGARVSNRMVIRDATVRLRCTGETQAKLMEAHSTSGEMEMITDHIINMHSVDLAKEVQPAIETALAMVLEDIANKFLKTVPPEMKCKYTVWRSKMLILWLFGVISSVHGGVEDNYINFGGFMCPREDKALGRCLRDALNAYIPKLATGLPEYGIPPCEPLLVPSLSIQQAAGPISVTSSFSDVTVRGPSNMRVIDVDVDPKRHKVVAKLFIPELRMRGNYNLAGQLLMLPIEGEGQFSSKYGDIDAIVTITLGRRARPHDSDALSCEQLDVSFHVGYASMQLENLFGGDGDLGHAMNKFLNENWQKLAQELQVPMEEALREFFKPLADHAFGTLKADDILISK